MRLAPEIVIYLPHLCKFVNFSACCKIAWSENSNSLILPLMGSETPICKGQGCSAEILK